MELKVETVDGFSLPTNCFIGVRVGDVLKQGRYEPHRCYHFPQIDRRRNAKVDIYQHVGTCIVAVDPDTKSSHEVAVTSMDPALPGTRIRINVQAKSEDSKANREERAKALKAQARDYLMKHNIEERLSDAVKALLKEQPVDPTAFLCKHLQADEQKAKEEPKTEAAPAELPQEPVSEDAGCQLAEDDDLNAIRKQSRDAFLMASEDGSLERTLRELRPDAPEEPAEAAAEPTEEEREKAKKDAIRMKASNVLITAAENGELERALHLVKKDTVADGLGRADEKEPATEQESNSAAAASAETQAEAKEEAAAAAAEEVPAAPEAQEEPAQQESNELRQEAADFLSHGVENGKLEEALEELKPKPESAATTAASQEELPPLMVRDLAVTAPTFVSFGMQPGFLFI